MPTGVYERSEKEKERLRLMAKSLTDKQKITFKGVHRCSATEFKKGIIPWNKGKPFLQVRGDKNAMKRPEIRAKVSAACKGKKGMCGKNHPNWQGGKTELVQKLRNSKEYAKWRKLVFERDKYICKICGYDKGHILEAHHYMMFSKNENLRFDVSNGITLCQRCHIVANEASKVLEILNKTQGGPQ